MKFSSASIVHLGAAVVAACVGSSALAQPTPVGPPPAEQGWRAVTVAQGVRNPWGITWLRDGRPLITSKSGTLHVLNGNRFHRIPMDGLPQVFTSGQGGLMDIALHPQYASNGLIYMTMSTGTSQANRTILVRGRFDGKRVSNIDAIFRASPDKPQSQHFGSRILWLPDGTLLMSIGDGGNPPVRVDGRLARENGQRLDTHLGAVLRLTEDGKAAPGNPFEDRDGAKPEIWSYGHRNIQGLARDSSGRIWANEHGPRGGDELNLLQEGGNFGWPRVTLGRDYQTGQSIGANAMAGMIDPKTVWTPAHAPSGLLYYTGSHFPNWKGSLLSGGLASEDVRRIVVNEQGNVTRQTRLNIGRRVRDVRQGPDGHIYILTDETNGRLMRIEPRR